MAFFVAGGVCGSGWAPTTQYDAGPMKVGGLPAGNARAQAPVLERTLAFLRDVLGVR